MYRPRKTVYQINLNIMITKLGNMVTKISFCRVGLWNQLKKVTRGTANSFTHLSHPNKVYCFVSSNEDFLTRSTRKNNVNFTCITNLSDAQFSKYPFCVFCVCLFVFPVYSRERRFIAKTELEARLYCLVTKWTKNKTTLIKRLYWRRIFCCNQDVLQEI